MNDYAIYALYPSVVKIINNIAYDKNGQVVTVDNNVVVAKVAELQAAEAQAEQAAKDAKASALAKLTALGLTQAEVTALIG